MIRLLTCILLSVAFIAPGYGQSRYDITKTDLPAVGLNKVLCMKNGNTMLFHFEPIKDITVKVYDSTHKQIGSMKHATRILDEYILKEAVFHGLFEVNGEAVLFIGQQHLGRHGLVRLRFNGTTGALIEEKLIGESPTAIKRTHFYVMKDPAQDSYAILFATDVPQFLDCKVYVNYYNEQHQVTREVPLEIDRKKYDYLRVVNASIKPNGICISLSMAKLKENSTLSTDGNDVFGSPNIYDHQYFIYYIPKDATTARSTSIDASTEVYPYCASYTYNSFARTLNLLMLSYREVNYRFGAQWLPAALVRHLFFKIDEDNMALDYKWLTNDSVTKQLQQQTDTSKFYEGIPLYTSTNENGLTSVVSACYSRYIEPENNRRSDLYTYLGNIAITQLDDDGKELRGMMLPFAQRYKSYSRYYHPYSLVNRDQSQPMFGDLPEQVYERQFFAFNTYQQGRNTFLVFNGNNTEYGSAMEKKDTVYNFNVTNGWYYKIDGRRNITKQPLYGPVVADEYKCSFIEGGDFDTRKNVYASLIQYKKGDEVDLRMAWSHLE